MTRGSRIASCSSRYGRHARISAGFGSRFSGGRHFTTFVMKTSDLFSSTCASSLSRTDPRPADERNTLLVLLRAGSLADQEQLRSRRSGSGTVFVRPIESSHRVHPATRVATSASWSSGVIRSRSFGHTSALPLRWVTTGFIHCLHLHRHRLHATSSSPFSFSPPKYGHRAGGSRFLSFTHGHLPPGAPPERTRLLTQVCGGQAGAHVHALTFALSSRRARLYSCFSWTLSSVSATSSQCSITSPLS